MTQGIIQFIILIPILRLTGQVHQAASRATGKKWDTYGHGHSNLFCPEVPRE